MSLTPYLGNNSSKFEGALFQHYKDTPLLYRRCSKSLLYHNISILDSLWPTLPFGICLTHKPAGKMEFQWAGGWVRFWLHLFYSKTQFLCYRYMCHQEVFLPFCFGYSRSHRPRRHNLLSDLQGTFLFYKYSIDL